MLSRTKLDNEQTRLLDIVTSSGQSLLELVDQIMLFSEIDSGQLQLVLTEFDLAQLVDRSVQKFAQKASSKNLSLSSVAPKLDSRLYGPAQAARQVLNELLSNAVKFTDSGSVWLKVDIESESEFDITLNFSVADTGVGIAEERRTILFQPFTQEDSSITRRFGGIGLGLAISKRLVELVGGTMQVASQPEMGSTFSFTMKFDKRPEILNHNEVSSETKKSLTISSLGASAADIPSPEAPHSSIDICSAHRLTAQESESGKLESVLLVEDNPVNQRVAGLLLRDLGFDCITCSNGQEAVDYVTRNRVAIILMDCQMPVMDGFQATRLIRQHEQTISRHTPIIAMTANSTEVDAEKCLLAGMDDFISKPARAAQLKEVMLKWLSQDHQPRPPQAAHIRHSPEVLCSIEETFGTNEAGQLMQLFIEDTQRNLRGIEQAMQQRNSQELVSLAQAIAASATTLGFTKLGAIAQTMEAMHGDLIVCTNELAKLTDEFAAITLSFRKNIAITKRTRSAEYERVNILVLEDNRVTREALVCILSQTADFNLIGECANAEELFDLLQQDSAPDVVILDLELPGTVNGITAVKKLKSVVPHAKAVMLTANDSDEELFSAFKAGADGYVLKHNFSKRQLELAIRSVAAGNCWLDSTLAQRLLLVAAPLTEDRVVSSGQSSFHAEKIYRRLAEIATDANACSIEPRLFHQLQELVPRNIMENS